MLSLCFDDVASSPTLGYPNLAKPGLEPYEFDSIWPRALPLRLQMYLRTEGIPCQVTSVPDAPQGSWYPVALGWHDFDCDYFALMSSLVHQRLRSGDLRVLFYYHEGDNPVRITHHMDQLVQQHRLPRDCYLFVSANSTADQGARSHYFPDHDYFFRYINRHQPQLPCVESAPEICFTALVRTHKWWRATVMADLWRSSLLDSSLWSYQTACSIDDDPADNPIAIVDAEWPADFRRFQTLLPRYCDGSDEQAHNDHRWCNLSLYQQTRCHIVLETMFDVDQSAGAFLTEKTYKCIKFGQPFVVVGGPGSLQALRDQGYRVFDSVIDNHYDTIIDNNLRWQAVKRSLGEIARCPAQLFWDRVRDDVAHNQHQFQNKTNAGLDRLVSRLTTNLYPV